MSSSIEWLNGGDTINPIYAERISDGKRGWFCVKVGEECGRCYAEAQNVAGGNNPGRYGNGIRYALDQKAKVRILFDPKILDKLTPRQAPKKVFPCSMTDMFGDFVETDWITAIYDRMELCSQHTFLVLTKRPARRRKFLEARYANRPPAPNIWEFVSAGLQESADEFIPELLATSAAVRGLSAEPLLGPLDLRGKDAQGSALDAYDGDPKLDLVIIGGESGNGAHHCDIGWIRSLIGQCRDAGRAAFVKQLGAKPVVASGSVPAFDPLPKLRDRKGGSMEEWPEDLRVRQMPDFSLAAQGLFAGDRK